MTETALRAELRRTLAALRLEMGGLLNPGARTRHAGTAAACVLASVATAQALHLSQPEWAGISAFVSTQATAPAALHRGLLRILGTAIGAGIGVVLAPSLLYDAPACVLVLMLAGFAGVLGMLVSPHGYAWLLGSVTVVMVLLGAVGDPSLALTTGVYRTLEVAVGTLTAMAAAAVLMPADPAAASPAPGWRDLTGAQWPAMRHAARAGVAIGLVPVVWVWLGLPGLAQMAVTIVAVMAVPMLTGHAADDSAAVLRRGLHRALGCLVGGIAALAVLSLSLQDYLPWLLLLGAGVWAGTVVHTTTSGVSYVGTQGTVVFILTLVQGFGPPDSVLPGVTRLVAILGGLLVLTAVSLLLLPPVEEPP